MPAAFEVDVCTRGRAGDPATLAVGAGDHAIQRDRQFQRDVGTTEHLSREKPGDAPARVGRENILGDVDPRRAQPGKTLSGRARIGIDKRGNYARRACGNKQVRTGRTPGALMRTGLQRHIDSRAFRGLPRLGQRHRFGMRTPPRLGPAAPNGATVLDDYAANIGIGGGTPAPTRRQSERGSHDARVVGAQRPYLDS